ncbi:hypothetical protein ABZY44_20445 [Streptomyces sp. NPDC006544]|uniref:hypothetical protein n=1 Tax=Streptomyces sp. NPDC006544 TaxID=3154583 RepID=UPI0033B10549
MDTFPEGGDPACLAHLLCPTCGRLVSERLAPCCARLAGPVRHPWLGVLRPDAEGRLTGVIEMDPAAAPAGAGGATDCGVTIGPGGADADAGSEPVGLDEAAARIRRVLGELEALKDFALAGAPAHWRRRAEAAGVGPPVRERLFLYSVDVLAPDATDVTFGHGGVGAPGGSAGPGAPGGLLVRVDGSGRPREVRAP